MSHIINMKKKHHEIRAHTDVSDQPMDESFLPVDSKDSDQTELMPWLKSTLIKH